MFGRDEGGSEFTFTQNHIDQLCVSCLPSTIRHAVDTIILIVLRRLTNWLEFQGRAAVGTSHRNLAGARKQPPTPDQVFRLDLCISDQNKTLLLANDSFIPYL